MSFGLQVFSKTGRVNVDSLAYPSSLIEVYYLPKLSRGASSSKSYPAYAGATIFVVPLPTQLGTLSNFGIPQVSISYSAGYPTVTYTDQNFSDGGTAGDIYVYIFLKKA